MRSSNCLSVAHRPICLIFIERQLPGPLWADVGLRLEFLLCAEYLRLDNIEGCPRISAGFTCEQNATDVGILLMDPHAITRDRVMLLHRDPVQVFNKI